PALFLRGVRPCGHRNCMAWRAMSPSKTVSGSREPPRAPDRFERLRKRLAELERSAGAHAIGLALYDEESRSAFSWRGERWFHAASTIKVAILIGVYSAIHRGALRPEDRLHVRNRFHSALDGLPFRVNAERDGNPVVQAAI